MATQLQGRKAFPSYCTVVGNRDENILSRQTRLCILVNLVGPLDLAKWILVGLEQG